jgi:serine/threonine-protein kinase RsbT
MVVSYSQTFRVFGRDFQNAGKASTEIRTVLKSLGVHPAIIRRMAIASYEAEMNVVMYAEHAVMTLELTPNMIRLAVDDYGPGIPDIERAMQEGYSTASPEMREMGFGAGMGLPNIRKNADEFTVTSTVGTGTKLMIALRIN